jgi:hypothetical protein
MILADISCLSMTARRPVPRTLLLGAILISFGMIGESCAESVEYAGRSFQVGSLREVDPDNVAVEVQGQQLFASQAAAGRAVFKIYAQKPELLEKDGALQGYGSWLATLPSKGDEEGAELAVERFVATPDILLDQKMTFYSELIKGADGQKVLWGAVSSIDQGDKVACSALGFLTHSDQLALKTRGQSWFTGMCPQALVELAQRLIMGGDRTSGIIMLRAAGVFSSDGGIGDAARTSLERIEALETALRSQDPSQLESALKVGSFDALLSAYFEKTRPQVIAEFSSRAIAEGKPVVALKGLALLDFSNRTTIHHELFSKALEALRYEDQSVLRIGNVRAALASYASKDELIRRQYLTMLEGWIGRALNGDNPGEALSLLDLLKDVRLDPSVENDALRGAIAESFVDNGDDRAAEVVLSGLVTNLPWMYRFRLLLKRDVYMLIMVALGCVVILRWKLMFLGFMKRRRRAGRIAREAERRAAEAAERERYHSQFADDALRADGFMDVDEYAASLKKFYLHPSASLADIKNAYRLVVKTLHPDVNPRATKEDTDRFIDLTKAYERLLVLHAEREQRSRPSK